MTGRGASSLERALTQRLDARRSSKTIRGLTIPPSNAVDFSSNDFLSLSTSQELRTLFLRELDSIPHLASGGSRLLDGNSPYTEALENDIARFHGAETGLLCNSGFDANAGLFSCLPQKGDVVVYDEFIHASVHDGMRLSRAASFESFAHNDVEALRDVLGKLATTTANIRNGKASVFIAVEAVYSMDGDVAPVQAIVDLLHEILPHGNGHLIVDEAHSTGWLGPQGRGLVCALGLQKEVLVRLHTFGKALACNGAIILCSHLIRSYLLNYARPLIYTTFLSYPALAAIRASYTLLQSGRTEPLADHLSQLQQHLHKSLLVLASSASVNSSKLVIIPARPPSSPIFSLRCSRPKELAAYCQARGFVVRGIVPPTVPAGAERVRICLHAGNTVKQVTDLVTYIGGWARLQIDGEIPGTKL